MSGLPPVAALPAPAMVAAARQVLVGRQRDIEVVAAALAAGRSVLLEGPPGTGKTTLLRALAGGAGVELFVVEGNAELSPGRLVGHHDPSRVLSDGYQSDTFMPGPLVEAMTAGGLLYVEELNRVPEETLNVLLGVLSERRMQVPRYGEVVAAPTFRLVAAMNPFDAVGTGRITPALYDRTCRVGVGYQSEAEERDIVRRATAAPALTGPALTGPAAGSGPAALTGPALTGPAPTGPAAGSGPGGGEPVAALVDQAVRAVRLSREHPDLRIGASVRGAIDVVAVAGALAGLRGGYGAGCGLDAALTALSGRITLKEGVGRRPEAVVEEIWAAAADRPPDDGADAAGKALRPGPDPTPARTASRNHL